MSFSDDFTTATELLNQFQQVLAALQNDNATDLAALQVQVTAALAAKNASDAQLAAANQMIATLQAQLSAQGGPFVRWVRPSGPGYVRYEDVYKSGMSFQQVMNAAGKTNILTLPEGQFLFDADLTNPQAWIAALRLTCRGVAGSGANTVLAPRPGSFKPRPGHTDSAQKMLDMDQNTPNQYLGGFVWTGADFGGQVYNAVQVSGPNAIVEHMLFAGANRGLDNKPTKETGALSSWQANGMIVRNVELDQRDASGNRVGTSPIMLNSSDNVTLQDVYAHHSYGGTVTNWAGGTPVTRATYIRVRSEHNGTSKVSGSGFNFERANPGAVILLQDCTFVTDLASNPGGVHLQVNGDRGSAKVSVKNPAFDGPSFTARIWASYGKDASGKPVPNLQQRSDIVATDANGNVIPVKFV